MNHESPCRHICDKNGNEGEGEEWGLVGESAANEGEEWGLVSESAANEGEEWGLVDESAACDRPQTPRAAGQHEFSRKIVPGW